MAGHAAEGAREEVRAALTDAASRQTAATTTTTSAPPPAVRGAGRMLALQRSAGNAAVNALMAARQRSPGEAAISDIDGGLREIRRDEPAIEPVEKGLRAAQAAGVPVDLEGTKPPASALAVTLTGFGPASVAPRGPVPPPKPVPAVSPLGKVAAKAPARRQRAAGPATARGGAKQPAVAGPGASGPSGAPGVGGGGAVGITAETLLRPPVPPTAGRPEDDPAFTSVTRGIAGFAKAKRAHARAASKAGEAQGAAIAPSDDVAGQAKASKVDSMDAQQPGSFDKKAFIAAVKAAIEAKSPKTLKEADNYKESGKAGEVKGEVSGLVSTGKEGQSKDIEAATEAPPDQSKALAKQVTPMAQEQPGPTAAIPAAGAAPKPAPAEQTNLQAGKHQADQELASGGVTESQLAKSNEPQFVEALGDKKAAAAHADAAPGQYRKHEQGVIQQGKADAAAETSAAVTGMQGAKGAAIAKLVAEKGKAKSKDETKRAEVTAKVQSIFAATEAEVRKILDGIDPKVDAAFERGEAAARAVFEQFVAAKMSAYKKDRYGGWLGGLRWAKDKLLGMPEKVNEFYVAGRELYLQKMDGVISQVAEIVGTDLKAAKSRIASGRAEIATYVKSLPADLKKVGAEASQEIDEKFGQLESDVNDKQDAVVDSLATKFVEARKGLDERIESLQAENKGLVDKAIGAIKAVINTIRELVAMLTGALARVAGVIGDIVKAPVEFLGNLIAGIKGGILKFKDNIVEHLRKGLMGWLFGALAAGGVELPETFDLRGIIKLLASLFGLTWANIRNRLIRQIGAKAMEAIERGVAIFQTLATVGVGGLWELLLEKLGDIKEMILEKVKSFVVDRIITAGITWLIGLLNPAAAFIKACKLIYDVVMFFVSNAARIAKFVDTVIDSVADVVKGNVGGVVNKINDVLGQMVPIMIGFFASVIGLGGIGQKIREIVGSLQKPINQALDFVIKTGLKLAAPIIRGLKGVSGKVKAKVAAGKAYVKGKVDAGKEWLRRVFRKPFSVAGTSHHVAGASSTGRFKLTIASTELSVAEHQAAAAAQAKKQGRPALADEALAVVKKAATIEAAANANTADEAKIRAGIAELAVIVQKVWARIGYTGEPSRETFLDAGSAGAVGEMGRHADQGTRGYKGEDTRQERDRLESEHVVPRDWLMAFVDTYLQLIKKKSAADKSLYDSMTTIMIYKGAARLKTYGVENERGTTARKIADNLVGRKLHGLVGKGAGKDPDAVAEAVRRNFDGPIASRVRITQAAVKKEHQMNQRPGSPVPSDTAIAHAAMRQLLDVIEFLVRAVQRTP